jgi:hypothetical protein
MKSRTSMRSSQGPGVNPRQALRQASAAELGHRVPCREQNLLNHLPKLLWNPVDLAQDHRAMLPNDALHAPDHFHLGPLGIDLDEVGWPHARLLHQVID